MGREWTDRELETLQQLVAACKRDTDIAKALGRTIYSVKHCRQRYGWLKSHEAPLWQQWEDDFLVEAYQGGWSVADIATKLERTKAGVRSRLQKREIRRSA